MKKSMRWMYDVLHSLRKLYWRIFKIQTRGVRVILIKDNRVLLVKHRYGNLWVFPGGGLKKQEDAFSAAQREVLEEVSIHIKTFSKILGVYSNKQSGRCDTVHVVVAEKWFENKWRPNWEIKERRWFDISHLPKTASRATYRRIQEYISDESVKRGKVW